MTSRSSHKRSGLGLLTVLILAAGTAQAGTWCPTERIARPAEPALASAGAPQFQERMRWIEQALGEGRISAYDAGRLMRQQWELAQFQQGFMKGGQATTGLPGGSGCLSTDLVAKIAPLGDMAVSGMQSAGSLMRTLMQQTERLITEFVAPDNSSL